MSVWRNLHLLKGRDLNLGQNPICAREIFSALQLSIACSVPVSQPNHKLTQVKSLRAGGCRLWMSLAIALSNTLPTRGVQGGGEGRRTAVERAWHAAWGWSRVPEVKVILGFRRRTQQLPLAGHKTSPSEHLQASEQQFSCRQVVLYRMFADLISLFHLFRRGEYCFHLNPSFWCLHCSAVRGFWLGA